MFRQKKARGDKVMNQPKEPSDGNGQNRGADATDVRQDQQEQAYFGGDGEKTASSSSDFNARQENATQETVPTGSSEDQARHDRLASAEVAAVQAQADELGEAIYAKFMHLLKDKLQAKGGQLTDDDVEQMAGEFKEALGGIKTAFLEAVDSFTRARERNRVGQSRNNLFQRLLVKNFEASFVDEKTLEARPDMLSRRMLPGFFTMLSLMFGKARLADYEERTKNIVERIRESEGESFTWDDVYKSLDARKLALRAEVEIAEYFREFDKRLVWMIALINSNLIPLDANLAPLDENRHRTPWIFRKRAATTLLSGLFHDLNIALKKQNVRETFVERLGEKVVDDLDTVLTKLQ